MISLRDVYHVVAATIPLYVVMILAYISVRWGKLFSPEQCSGINKFVAKFSIPLLSFQVISGSNLYKVNLKLLLADFIQKFLAVFLLAIFAKLKPKGNLTWIITGLSVSTLPNTLILGIPLIKAIFGDAAAELLAQLIALQSLVWYNLLLLLFELNATKESYMMSPSEVAGTYTDNRIMVPKLELEVPGEPELEKDGEEEATDRPPRKKTIMVILLTVGRKLIINPNTHATLAGIIWSSIHFRWGVNLPKIVEQSISILSDGGLGMAMFSIGVFMASQASIIACGTKKAILAMALKFVLGPVLMAISSIAVGLRGQLFRLAIVQAALPQGIVPFVFAKEYNIHPTILSTGVIFGMLIAIPIALAYYFLLEI
ncbi:putative auxin efflux carrier component 5 isoform X2 [Solanum tuberosum]|uniref:putative auxin efflux carrier component 5 isoform X2 n=1 Tax=Solanum tuberosum TaxID=4113 RepID=UPI0003D27E4E|nr:PREDICTED: putative auxin efflux carrier component 5 isoform X2 [Solanum tuberosum]